MSDMENVIQTAVKVIEDVTELMYESKFGNSPKPPVKDQFKASAMAEIARRIRTRAVKIEEDWLHFTRDLRSEVKLKDRDARELLDSLVEKRAKVMFQQMLDVRKENTEEIKKLHEQVCEDPDSECEKFFTESVREFIMMRLSDLVETHQDVNRRVN